MKKDMNDRLFDVRVSDRNVKRGDISDKDLKSHIKALPDLKDNYDFMTVEDEEQQSESQSE